MKPDRKKFIALTLAIECVIVIALFAFSTTYIRTNLEKEIQDQMLSVARYAASIIRAGEIEKIESVDDPHFAEVRSELERIEQAFNMRQGLAYVVELRDGKPVFSVMTNPETFRGHAYPEEILDQINPVFDGEERISGLYEDRYGTWISVLVPLKHEDRVVAALELDFSGVDYQNKLYDRVLSFSVGLVFLLAAPFGFIFFILIKLFNSHEKQLAARETIHQQKITAMKQKEEFKIQLMNQRMTSERQKSIALSEQKSQFFSMIVHDMKNPLTTITIGLELLRKKNTDENLNRYLELCTDQLKYLMRLIQDITTLKELEFTGFKPGNERVDLAWLIAQIVDANTPAAQMRGLSFDLNVEKVSCVGDRSLMRRLAENLVSNAVKYSRQDSTISVDCTVGEGVATISISNTTRAPIPDDALDSIFMPFKRLERPENGDDAVAGSNGLGLAICKAIVVAHGGTIRAVSPRPSTINFITTIPVQRKTSAARLDLVDS